MDIKRLLIACVLSAAVLLIWPVLFPQTKQSPSGPPATPVKTAAVAAKSAEATALPEATPTAPLPVAPVEKPAPVDKAPQEPVVASEKTILRVSTANYEARLSNRGGDILSFRLKNYRDSKKNALDLVRAGSPFPQRILRLDPADPFLAKAAESLFRYEVSEIPEKKTVNIQFRYQDEQGRGLVRTYSFRPGFVIHVKVERTGGESRNAAVVLGPGIGNPSEDELKSHYTKPGGTVLVKAGGKVTRDAKDAHDEPISAGTGLIAAGIEDNYFMTSFLPSPSASVTLRPALLEKTVEGQEKKETLKESEVVLSSTGVLETDIYLGPKDIDVLDGIRPGLEKVVDFGWFSILAKPLLLSLRWIYGWAANWGLAIIIITIIIKILLFPLTYKQLASMKKMSVLQPKVETIRTKWASKIKSDPQARVKMNEEMMSLYKTENVNPASGCVPLLLQMPILFAFYQVLANSIELRQAPFTLWLQDLSTKDPYYVTPILMTITMWMQQQLTPQMGDPTQRKILAIMPFIFGFMFKDMPSGLVLYWLVQNVLTIAQQILLDRYTDLGPSQGAKKKKK